MMSRKFFTFFDPPSVPFPQPISTIVTFWTLWSVTSFMDGPQGEEARPEAAAQEQGRLHR